MSSTERLTIALGAFIGGLAIGLFFAPASGERTRRVMRVGARRTSRWLTRQVEDAQENILEAGDEAADRLKKAAEEVVNRYVPDWIGDDESWQDVYSRTAKDIEDEKQ